MNALPPESFIVRKATDLARSARLMKVRLNEWRHRVPLTCWPKAELRHQTTMQFLAIFGLFASLVLVGNFFVIEQRRAVEVENLRRFEKESIDTVQRHITTHILTGLQDILFLQELPELESYVKTGNPAQIQLLGEDLLGMMQLREDYEKIRIMAPSGMELMRVYHQGEEASSTPPSELQNKSDRFYYPIILKLKPGEVYISPFNLDEEHGKPVTPVMPTFRLISGVFNSKQKLVCAIVINYNGTKLLQQIEQMQSEWFQVWMMGEDGCWIKEPERPFQSSVVTTTTPSPLFNRLGKLQSEVTAKPSGQIQTRHGLYLFRRINPLKATLMEHPNLGHLLSAASSSPTEDWIIISQVKSSKLNQLAHFMDGTNALILVLLLIPGACGSWLLSYALALKRDSDRKFREASDTLRQVTDSIPGAVYQIGLDAEQRGRFILLSRGTRIVLGLDINNSTPITYDYFLSTILPADRAEYDRTISESYLTRVPWACDFRIYDGNSCLKWIRASATVNRVSRTETILSGIFTDITSLKIAEIKRRTSEERLELALQAANDGLWDWNVNEGTIYFSARWLQMLGYETHELPHHFNTWKTLLHPDDLKPTLKKLNGHIENKTNHYEMEFRMRTKDGGWKWILSRGAVVQRDPLGRPERMIGTHTDISERKELEKSLKTAKDAAEQASKTKSTFLAIMSHELRTPMNSVCGFVDSLKRTELQHEQADYVDKIDKSSSKLLFIINDILDYSKIEAGRLRLECISFDAIRSIQETSDILRPQMEEKNITFEFHVDGPDRLPVRGDPIRLHQVVVNLLANAIKFTERGKIALNVHCNNDDDGHCTLEVSVQDSGIGMSVDQQSVLFQPFSQVDSSTTRKYGGTGLGLAICKRLCEMMEGHIWVVSQPGHGSTFTFTVRLEQSQTVAIEKPAEPMRKPSADTNRSRAPQEKFRWKVLLADHDPVSRMVASELLNEIGCQVEVVEDSSGTLTPEKLRGYNALLLDEATLKSGLPQTQQTGSRPFYCFGLVEDPLKVDAPTDSVDGWINQPVDIRTLSRAFSKAVKDRPLPADNLAALQ